MDDLDLFMTLEKLFLIAHALDNLLETHYDTILHDTGVARKRTMSTIITGISELHHGLEVLAMSDPLALATDGLLHSDPSA